MSRGPGTDVRDHGLRRVIETGTGVSTKLYSVLGVVREEGGRRGRAFRPDRAEDTLGFGWTTGLDTDNPKDGLNCTDEPWRPFAEGGT